MASNIDHQAITKILQMLKIEGGTPHSKSEVSHKGNELSSQCSGGGDSHSTTAFAVKNEEEKRYQVLKSLFETVDVDSITIIKELISTKDDKKPLLDCVSKSSFPTRTRVGIEEAILGKTVVLLISDLDIEEEEIFTLNQSHSIKSDLQYEIVWIPIVDRSTPSDEANRKKFEQLQEKMRWYTVVDPWLLDPVVVRYIKEVWHFSKKLILVVLDPQGKVVCNNALHMFMIWGNGAYPFTAAREESLWIGESWTLDLLVKIIDQTIVESNSQGKVICLHGGVDIGCISALSQLAKEVAQSADISMELVYVGNRFGKEHMDTFTSFITRQKLSQCLLDPARIGYFWTRLKSMRYSRTQCGYTFQNDKILQEVSTILRFEKSHEEWAIISKGSDVVTANGDTILEILREFKWSENSKERMTVIVKPAKHQRSKKNHQTRIISAPAICARTAQPVQTRENKQSKVHQGTILPLIPDLVVCKNCGKTIGKVQEDKNFRNPCP